MPGHPLLVELLGWAATAVFVASYFARRSEALVRLQIAGALLWLTYGALLHAAPVIGANLLVAAAAAWKARRPAAAGDDRKATDRGVSSPPLPSPLEGER